MRPRSRVVGSCVRCRLRRRLASRSDRARACNARRSPPRHRSSTRDARVRTCRREPRELVDRARLDRLRRPRASLLPPRTGSSGRSRSAPDSRHYTRARWRPRGRPATSPPRSSRASSRAGSSPGSSTPSRRARAAENYSIAIPPPNVTGALHMGHALNGSIQDTLIRYAPHARQAHEVDPRHRPRRHRDPDAGRDGCWQPRARAARSSAARRSSSACGSWREQYGGTIIEQFKRLGASCDYEDERFTLDEALRRARS